MNFKTETQLRQELSETWELLRAEREARQGETAMLDWIEKIAKQQKIEIARSILGSGFEIGEWPSMLVTVRSGTLRDAIQAAMNRKDRT